MIVVTDGEQTVDELLTQFGIAHDASYPLRAKGCPIVVGKHGEDRYLGTLYERQCFFIYPCLKLTSLRIDEQPLRNDHVEVLHVLFE